MILQYLSDEGYYASRAVVHDEANVKWKEREERGIEAKRLKQAILGKRTVAAWTISLFIFVHLLITWFKTATGPKSKNLAPNPLLRITDHFCTHSISNSTWNI